MNLEEKTLIENTLYHGKILDLNVDTVLLPNGKEAKREKVVHHGGVVVAPLTDDGRLVFVRQFRYAYNELLLELPAGKLEKGEDAFEAGVRELKEEIGAEADEYIDLGVFYPSPGYTNEVIHLYAAKGLRYTGQNLDDDEFLEVVVLPFEDAVKMVMDGEIKDGKTQALILKLKCSM